MENEENRGLINKKASEDQLVGFLLALMALILLYYLSLSLSLLGTSIFLGALWHWIKKGKEGKTKEGASKEEQDQTSTTRFFAGKHLHVWFP